MFRKSHYSYWDNKTHGDNLVMILEIKSMCNYCAYQELKNGNCKLKQVSISYRKRLSSLFMHNCYIIYTKTNFFRWIKTFKSLNKDLTMYTEFNSRNFIVIRNRMELKHIFKMLQIMKIFGFM